MPRGTASLKVVDKRDRDLIDELQRGTRVAPALRAVEYPNASYYKKKRTCEEFRILVENAIREGDKNREALATGGRPLGLVDDDRKNDFLIAFEKSGSVEKACKASNLNARSVALSLDEEEAEYDPDFALEFRRVEKFLLRKIEDGAWHQALGSSKESMGHKKWFLERRLPHIYGSKKEIKVESKTDHGFDPQSAIRLLRDLFTSTDDTTELVAKEPERVLPTGEVQGDGTG